MSLLWSVAGLLCVTEIAPDWSRLRNRMILRVYNDVTLGLTLVRLFMNELLVAHRRDSHNRPVGTRVPFHKSLRTLEPEKNVP